jgi:ribosomal 50S subunit-recycling heat shock protein
VSLQDPLRGEARCEGGKVEVNGEHAKPHRILREGDRVRINRGFGRHQDVVVRILIDQHVKKSEARALYDDVTPKPDPRGNRNAPHRARCSAPRSRRRVRPTAAAGARFAAPKKARWTVPRNQEVIRQWKVLHALETARHGAVIDALADELGVTTRTIRRDLAGAAGGRLPALRRKGRRGSRALAARGARS